MRIQLFLIMLYSPKPAFLSIDKRSKLVLFSLLLSPSFANLFHISHLFPFMVLTENFDCINLCIISPVPACESITLTVKKSVPFVLRL